MTPEEFSTSSEVYRLQFIHCVQFMHVPFKAGNGILHYGMPHLISCVMQHVAAQRGMPL